MDCHDVGLRSRWDLMKGDARMGMNVFWDLTYHYYRTSTTMKENIALTFNAAFSTKLEVASHLFEYWTLVVFNY